MTIAILSSSSWVLHFLRAQTHHVIRTAFSRRPFFFLVERVVVKRTLVLQIILYPTAPAADSKKLCDGGVAYQGGTVAMKPKMDVVNCTYIHTKRRVWRLEADRRCACRLVVWNRSIDRLGRRRRGRSPYHHIAYSTLYTTTITKK